MKATYFAAAAAVALAGMSGTAHAAVSISPGLNEPFTYDFRGTDPVSDLADEGAVFDGSTAGFGPVNIVADGNLIVKESLTQSSAGLGVGVTRFGGKNDEIDVFLFDSESITLTFTSPRSLREVGITKAGTDDGFFFDTDTKIKVTTPEGGTQTLTSSSTSVPPTATGQLSTLVFSGLDREFGVGDSITFEAKQGSFAVAGYSAVPLPAAAWLMIGGLGIIGAYARRSRKAAPTA